MTNPSQQSRDAATDTEPVAEAVRRQAKQAEQKRRAELLSEFTAEKEQAPLFDLEGFKTSTKQPELRRYLEQRTKLAEKLINTHKPKERERLADDLEAIDRRINKLVVEVVAERPDERDPLIDEEGMRVLLNRAIPDIIKLFVEKNCRFVYDPNAATDRVDVRKTDKIEFIFGPQTMRSKTEAKTAEGKAIEFFNPEKLVFQIRRMIGILLTPPSNWEEHLKNIKSIVSGKRPTWEDFVALYLTDPAQAEALSPEAAKTVEKALLFPELDSKIIRERLAGGQEFGDDELAPEGKGVTQLGLKELKNRLKFQLKLFFKTLIPITYTDWYERFVAEFEDKEKGRIITRDEHVTIRDNRLAIFLAAKDKFSARTYLLSIAETGDQRGFREHLYLYTFDPLYRASGGRQITRESYDFHMRLHRISNRARRHGNKPGEFAPKVLADGTEVYVKLSSGAYEEDVFYEVDKKTPRELNNTAQEYLEWIKRRNGRLMKLDEQFGSDEPPFGVPAQEWPMIKNTFETNDLDELHGKGTADRVKRFAASEEGWYKVDADQMMLIARQIASDELARKIGINGEPLKVKIGRSPFGTEHFRLALKEAVDEYGQDIEKYQQHLSKGGKRIPRLDRFISFINRYKQKEIGRSLEKRELSQEDQEAYQITQEEPIPALSRAPEETAGKIELVEQAIEGKEGEKEPGMRKRLEQEVDSVKSAPIALRNYLKKDLGNNLAELLRHPQDLKDVVVDIYNLRKLVEKPEDFEASLRTYHEQCYQALLELRGVYVRNQSQFEALAALQGWHRNFQPFLEKIVIEKDQQTLRDQISDTQELVDEYFKQPRFDEQVGRYVFETREGKTPQELQDRFGELKLLPDEKELRKTDFHRELAKRVKEHTDPAQRADDILAEDFPRWLYFKLKGYEAALQRHLNELLKPKKPKKPKTEPDAEAEIETPEGGSEEEALSLGD